MKTSAFKVIFTFSLLKELTGRYKLFVQFSEPKNIYTDTNMLRSHNYTREDLYNVPVFGFEEC